MTRSKVLSNVLPAEVRRFKLLRRNGLSFAEIGRRCKRDQRVVRQYCNNERRPKCDLKDRVVRAVRVLRKKFPRKNNISVSMVATKLGLSKAYVGKAMKGLYIPERKAKVRFKNREENADKVYRHGIIQW